MIVKETFNYVFENSIFEGIIVYNSSLTSPVPAVMVFHTWMGQSAFEVQKAEDLANLGYVALAVDMYGVNRRANNADEASILMHECVDDRALLFNRARAAYNALYSHKKVDNTKISAIGFCFGGKCVLDLARGGLPLCGVVSFHGIYDAPNTINNIPIQASILVLHGWEDPLASPDALVKLGKELTQKKADWQILAFGNTGHAFTNPNANSHAEGMYFVQRSNDRSWLAMNLFLKEVFNL
jgi:dienelactone hydrolase